MPSLSDKLKSLGVKVGPEGITKRPGTAPQPETSVNAVLGGYPYSTRQGETYLVDSHYPIAQHQNLSGLFSDTSITSRRILANWVGNPELANLEVESFAFLDTETTGLSGGTGKYAFLIGVGRFEQDEFHLAQFFMRDPTEEPAQLFALEEFLAPSRALVSFNGKSFDAPLLNTRFLYHGWHSPLLDLVHVDLLHLARRLWRDRLPSRTLGSLEVQILGSERTEQDIPGWMIPQIYFDYLHTGDPQQLQNVLYHNAMDVVSLAALFKHTTDILADPFSGSIQYGVDIIALARLFEDLGDLDTAISLYIQGLEYEDRAESLLENELRLPQQIFLEAIHRLAMIHKHQDNFAEAILLWQEAARRNYLPAHVELAKYYEHRDRDYSEALRWAAAAYEIIDSLLLPGHKKLEWRVELENRILRLKNKIRSIPRV